MVLGYNDLGDYLPDVTYFDIMEVDEQKYKYGSLSSKMKDH